MSHENVTAGGFNKAFSVRCLSRENEFQSKLRSHEEFKVQHVKV